MGQNKRRGLDFYLLDVDMFQDLRIRKLIKYQGGKAVTVYTLLLCLIYKGGYYTRWDKELPFIISEQTGFEEVYISEVIKSCLSLGLFSCELYRSHGILTSKSIQIRYMEICELCRRKSEIDEFSLVFEEKNKSQSKEEEPVSSEKNAVFSGIGVSSCENCISSEEINVNSEETISAKRKEAKEKYNSFRYNNNIILSSSLHSEDNSSKCDFDPLSSTQEKNEIDFGKFVDFWNKTMDEASSIVPRIRKVDRERKKHIMARAREYGKQSVFEMVQKVSKSDFLNGKNDRGWVASFSWVILPRNFLKVIEGVYDNKNIPNANYQTRRDNDNRKGALAGGRTEADFESGF